MCHAAASRAEQQAAIARAQQSLEDAEAQRSETEKKRNELRKETAALIDAKTATKLVDAGATKNAQGLALLIGLLRERLEELRRLPQLEKEARKLLRRVRRAERVTVRITLMLRALRNRHDEAIEFAEISSGAIAVPTCGLLLVATTTHACDCRPAESDDEYLDDEDFDLHDPEEVKARMEVLAAKQLEKAKYVERGRARCDTRNEPPAVVNSRRSLTLCCRRLRELAVPLPEIRFDIREAPTPFD